MISFTSSIILKYSRKSGATVLVEKAMKFLLKVAGDFVFRAAEKSGGAYREEASVHALNVLRMLSRDAALKYVVIPYLTEALMLAVEGYTSSRYLFEKTLFYKA